MLNSKPNKQKTTDSDLRINARKALDIKGIVALFFQPSMCLGEFRTPATHTTELFVTAVTVSGCYFFFHKEPHPRCHRNLTSSPDMYLLNGNTTSIKKYEK